MPSVSPRSDHSADMGPGPGPGSGPETTRIKTKLPRHDLPESVGTLVVGNGPAALFLSYLLSGHVPEYRRDGPGGPHPDTLLDGLLGSGRLDDALLDNADLAEHLTSGNRVLGSAVAATVSSFVDELVAPGIDHDVRGARTKTRVRWRAEPAAAVDHIVVGTSFAPGGQWSDADVSVRTLSYAEMLSLPGYTFEAFYETKYGQPLPEYLRPLRSDVAEYYSAYARHVGVADRLYTHHTVLSLRRSSGAGKRRFSAVVQAHDTERVAVVFADRVVLATGVYSHQIPPDPVLAPLLLRPPGPAKTALVIGSGFSAADAILVAPPDQRIVHVYKWDPHVRPSPLRSCHREAYPEYASLYRLMRLAAAGRPVPPADVTTEFGAHVAALAGRYEGIANGRVVAATADSVDVAAGDAVLRRSVDELKSFVGRIGIISYLSADLRTELGCTPDQIWATKETFAAGVAARARGRGPRAEATYGLEAAPDVFLAGSLAGTTLVRHVLGGCVVVA
ncbi:uncharacterized protein V1510DRAFT_379085, partial [Dipodascopsis tothii]|uniref:uncharacterized protein n=1 Tax=Dipodascopsis tothii TaxID=44089 RepID=UPI0034CDAC70